MPYSIFYIGVFIMIKEKKMYCENCLQEELVDYVVDSMGGVFCDERCFEEMGNIYISEYEIIEWIGDWSKK